MRQGTNPMRNRNGDAGLNALLSGHFLMAWQKWEMQKKVEYEEHFRRLEEEMDDMKQKIDQIIELLSNNETNPQEKVVVVKEMSYDEAKKLVIDYFNKHQEADIAELHQELGIEIEQLLDILSDLRKEKIIG